MEIAQTADHALRILEELGKGEALTPAELGRRLDLNRTVIHRLLKTLYARGFVRRQGGAYRPGVTLVRLAEGIEPDLRAIAAPVMAELAKAIGETVVLHVDDGQQAVVLAQAVATAHVVQVSHQIGSRHSLALGASGRAILAFLPEDRIARMLEPVDQPTVVARGLEAIRSLRFAVSHDELQLGVHGLAVPLLRPAGDVIGSLAVLVPALRARDLDRYVEPLWKASDEVVLQLEGSDI